MVTSSRLKLRNLDIDARQDLFADATGLDRSVLNTFRPEARLALGQADRMIEKAVGVLAVPVGVASNFNINGRDFLVPMATEEPSVVAAASNAARIARSAAASIPPAPNRSCKRRCRSSTLPTRRRLD